MVVAVYGGSFNPPHVAHAMVIGWLLWTGRADAVWIVPVYRHAFEGLHDKTLAPFDQRVAWCNAMAADLLGGEKAAARPDAAVRVEPVEADLPVPSYSIDTLGHLASAHPEHRFRLVVGADVLGQLPRWKQWADIEQHYSPIVVGRAGYPPVADGVAFPDVSSTEIRRRLAEGESVDHLVTRRVAALLSRSGG